MSKHSMRLSTRLTIAIVTLVVVTAGAVGLLTYRNIAAVAVPRSLARLDAHARELAGNLANIATSARADVKGFRHVIGLDEIIDLSRTTSLESANGRTLAQWRARIGRRFVDELEAKPSYAQFRVIGIADGGRELIRVERRSDGGMVRVVPDAELQRKADQKYFQQTIAANDGVIVVSAVELSHEDGATGSLNVPVLRISTPIFASDGTIFGVLVIDVDLRAGFKRIDEAVDPDTAIYVVNERGDYLAHPDARREFGFEFGTPFRIQDDFPALAQAMATGEQQPRLIENPSGKRFGAGLASVRPAQGPRISVIAMIPEEQIAGPALLAVRDSSLLGGSLAVFCAMVLAFVLARTLTKPLTQMTKAVTVFAYGQPLKVPTEAGGEIGVLARAFEKMAHDQSAKTAATRHDAEVFESIMTSMGEAVMLVDQSGSIVYANRAYHAMLGPATEASAQDWIGTYDLYHLDGVTPVPTEERPIIRSLRGEQVDGYDLLYRTRSSEKLKNVTGSARPIRNAAGMQTGAVIVFRDVTETKQIEHQLHQSQKLDAIGQLTGGVAHDFNNMLTVITGTAEMLTERLHDQPDLLVVAKLIDQAAERGAELTRHLLAFARKQALQPREVDINSLVIDTAQLLRSTLGEYIEIESMLESDVRPAHIDPSQLSSALLNLAVNARDAMPNGGKLTLETANIALDETYAHDNADVQPGIYVMIAVSDTGTGIQMALRDKVFEPFFTTKEAGKGTGLGLSMVYGFVKQSNGHIKIYSEEGYGTTIKLYLPCAAAQVSATISSTPPIAGGSETILVVEDDALVRTFVVAQLHSLGYKTLTASDGQQALVQIERGATFELLFTDVIMPGGMNGRQLANEVAKRRPELKVLYTSGYTENAIVHHGRLDPGVMLLVKPYRKSDLARMVRAALENVDAAGDRYSAAKRGAASAT